MSNCTKYMDSPDKEIKMGLLRDIFHTIAAIFLVFLVLGGVYVAMELSYEAGVRDGRLLEKQETLHGK